VTDLVQRKRDKYRVFLFAFVQFLTSFQQNIYFSFDTVPLTLVQRRWMTTDNSLCRDSALWFHDYDEVADAHCFGVASYSTKSLWREQWYFGNLGWHKTRLYAVSYHLFVVTSEHFKVVVDSSHIMVESAFKNNQLSVFIVLCIAASNLSQSPLTRQAPFQIFNI